ncbi:hypothetical protein C0995_001155 [Termitomyces sp. Mi166|nr:hypothetical protein C0995_001155 [Termitomyces sp. Mi166\
MRFNLTFIAAAVGALVSAAKAQRVIIGYPPNGTSIAAGSELTVELDRYPFMSSSAEVGLVIGIMPCPPPGCFLLSSDIMGTILYNGDYDSEYHAEAPDKPPHQNFTVTIPSFIPNGTALLGILRVSLLGASSSPFIETLNITLNVSND